MDFTKRKVFYILLLSLSSSWGYAFVDLFIINKTPYAVYFTHDLIGVQESPGIIPSQFGMRFIVDTENKYNDLSQDIYYDVSAFFKFFKASMQSPLGIIACETTISDDRVKIDPGSGQSFLSYYIHVQVDATDASSCQFSIHIHN